MLIFVHGAPTTLTPFRHPNLGVLSSPRRFYLDVHGWEWAADNDAFSKWDERRFLLMLDGIARLPRPRFVTAPDVVGAWEATLSWFEHWQPQLERRGLPIAYVVQDGQPWSSVPWTQIQALFVGGSTEWKLSDRAADLVRCAQRLGLWTHMGRVNSHRRLRYAKALGCDSVDGTSFSWFKDRWLREFLDHAAQPAQGLLR